MIRLLHTRYRFPLDMDEEYILWSKVRIRFLGCVRQCEKFDGLCISREIIGREKNKDIGMKKKIGKGGEG